MKNLLLICGLMLFSVIAVASAQPPGTYPKVSIYDVQYVPPESLAINQDNSSFLGDTITVEGVVANGPRSIWAGARWSLILVDEKGGPWNGLQIIQHDTSVAATNITAVKPGYKIRVTGFIEEFSYNVKPSQTQLALLVAPPVPVELVGFGYTIPGPTEVTCADLALGVGEKYECCQVIIKNATVINNAAPGNDMLIADATGQLNVDSWSNALYDSLSTGKYRWPQNGTNIHIKGYVRNNPNGIGLEIAPMTSADITILSTPPLITDIARVPAAPTSNDPVTVTAKIQDSNGTVSQALLHYRVGTTRWQTGNMSAADSIYSFTIPQLPDGTFVQYFIRAVDNVGDWSTLPGDTTTSRYFYTVRDQGLSIKDLQWTPFKDGNSGYQNMVVTVSGIVTASPDDILGDYILQDKAEPWCGIWVNDAAHTPHRGDSVRVTATVEESFNLTRLNFVTKFDSLGTGRSLEPLKITTGQARTGSPEAESYEGVLLEFNNVYVSDPFPDRPSNFGEIEINDGTGGYRVDENGTYLGNFDSTYALNDKFQKIIGIGWYSFNNYKLKPRSAEDVIGYQPSRVAQQDKQLALSYELRQNYPNPFNPATTIRYRIAKSEPVELTIYNLMGQKIRTLVNEVQSAGAHLAHWDGRNGQGQLVGSGVYFYSLKAGNFIHTRKMILLR